MNKSLGIKRIIKFNICVILLMILLIIGLYEVKDQKFLIGKLSNYLADDEIVNFVITVKDDKNKDRVIPNSKFIIKELIIENGVEKEGMPYDVNGNLLGKEEVINGEIVRTFTTDENGTIIEAFKTGNYKIEQILANSEIGYELPEEAVAYFGVNSDRSAEIELKLEEPVIISDGEVTRAQVYQYRVAGRNDGTALYYYNGKVSYIDEKDNIIWTKETSDIGTIKQIETTESGFDVLTETRFVQFDLEGNILFNKVLISGLDGIGKFQSYTRTEDGKIAIVGDFIGTITATINNNTVTKTSGNSGKLRSVFVATFDENYEISNINSYYSSTYYYKADSITYTDDSYIITYERGDTETNNEINTVDNFIRKVDRSTLKTVKINGENALEVPDGETASPARLIDSIVKGEEEYLYYIGVLNGTAKISASDTVNGNAITLTSTGRDGLVIKYNKDLKVVWAIKIGGAGDDHLFGVEVTEDTGIILGGDSSKGGITFSKEETEFGVPITSKPTGTAVKDGEWRGIVVKINSDGKAVWANGFGFSSDEGCYNLAAFTNNSFVLCGFSAVTSGGSSVEKVSFMRGNEIISSEEIEQKTSLDIFNSKKEYKITTEISNVEGLDKPGTISEALEGEEAYEIVAHGENSTKQIEINANDGYVIKSIKLQKEDSEGNITEENIEIPANSKNYVINTLENVRENINVVAEFKKATSKIIVHHYFKDTETPVLNQIGEPIADEEIEGNIDEEYSLKPSDKIASYYEVVEIPDSARGIFEDETKEIIFYYKYKEFAYTIEYYYAGVKDSDKTEAGLKATYQEVVKDYTDKIVTGYKFDKVEAVTISEDESQNVLKVYYVIDET